ncbi:GNAT family N-acetyltransferase [Campylobacter coli]|nr:GNAT family N-acetyltransferase [Campylobacter coli]EAK3951342.1 GNAT family N-acetyltransferase [Campylobacter jejuni]EAH6196783.1 GNAT family N-acetyltransferase [Campylobacter coli]EAH6791917.1 GNAT family N-acetyltransferase [Campylobacter coli]EAH7615176.1 GNAT family N-acetyltransferase [Campylobacter coli]EAH8488190.1 GNAT family N-acetyltransferase [Campylobacter coli]
MKIKKYNLNSKDIWNNFNKDAKNGLFMFDRNYMDYHSDRFMDNSLMFYEDEKLIALLPCNVVENILYSHQGLTFGGFIVDENMKQGKMLECFEVLKEYMKENNFKKLIYKSIPYIYHKIPAQEDLYALFRNKAELFRVDCSTTIDLQNVLKMSDLRKRCIKKAQKNKVEITSSEDFNIFLILLNSVLQKQHGVNAVHSVEELKLLYSRFPQNIKLFVAKFNGEIIAATLVFIYENLVHTQYLAANEKAREIGALDLLIKTLMDEFAKSKKYFDFGISTENGGEFLNHGLISQKEGFGGRNVAHQFFSISGGGD